MTHRTSCDGAGLRAALRAAVANLELHVDELNGLNVYPVPDGDTGSNMFATVRAALEEAEGVSEPDLDRVAAAISFGALMGARGNSGVITSQIFRGMAEAFGTRPTFSAGDLARALLVGSRMAYAAVLRPVEGTILTVIRESADAAMAAAERGDDIEAVLRTTVNAARESLERTPSLLPILREAGVVDAGGAGLVRLFEGALQHMVGSLPDPAPRFRGALSTAFVAQEDDGFGYETMFLLEPIAGGLLDIESIRRTLELMGRSVVVAGDMRAVKVHVHSEHPDEILAYGVSHGTLSRISVENLDSETRELRERRAGEFTDGDLAALPAGPATGPAAAIAVVAVVVGDGLAAVFRSLGCAGIVAGGAAANPSTRELLAAVEALNAHHVLLLPNNANVMLAARQVVGLASRPVTVIPTRNAVEGVAALLAFDPSAPVAETVAAMERSAEGISSLQVTRAVRDAQFGDRPVASGDVIVLTPDDGLVAADPDEFRAVLAGIRGLRAGFELLTLYYGDGVETAAAEALGRAIGEHLPDVEIELIRGGQPHHRYLIAAE